MRTRHALIAAAALSVIATAVMPSGAAARRAAVPSVIRLLSITTSQHLTDKPPKGPSTGDTLVATSKLLNAVKQFGKARGAAVGSDRGTTVLQRDKTLITDGVATLPGGTIHFR